MRTSKQRLGRKMEWWLLAMASLLGVTAEAESTLNPGCIPPFQVKDIWPGSQGSQPHALVDVHGTLFFLTDDGGSGIELWSSNGTEAGTLRARDASPGIGSLQIQKKIAVGAKLFFSGDVSVDSTTGEELWASDGTEAGTLLVKDIRQGLDSSHPDSLAVLNGLLLFTADDGLHGRELWRSDGTGAGTTIVKDLLPGPQGSDPDGLAVLGGYVFFSADDGSGGRELWRSDGTEAGTVLVRDIVPGPDSSAPSGMTTSGGYLYFAADDGEHGRELWRTDGTQEGTQLVADLVPGDMGSAPFNLLDAEGLLFFRSSLNRIWRSDGTAAGTFVVATVSNSGYFPRMLNAMVTLGQKLILAVTYGYADRIGHPYYEGVSLSVSDGSPGGLTEIASFPGHYSPGWPPIPGWDGPMPQILDLTQVGEHLVFRTHTGAVWRSDGTKGGTKLLDEQVQGKNAHGFTASGDFIYFSAGDELWAVPLAAFGDCTPPVITCPESMTVEAEDRAGATVHYPPASATDDVSPSPEIRYEPADGTHLPVGTTLVQATALDLAGNTSSCTFDVTVTPEPERGCGCGTTSMEGGLGGLLLGLGGWAARRRARQHSASASGWKRARGNAGQ